MPLPPLPEHWEPTRATLHAYAQAVGVIPRAHAAPHPKWWHIALTVRPDGLVTESMPLPEGGTFFVRMDLRSNVIVAEASTGERHEVSMAAGMTGTEMGERLSDAAAQLGLPGEYATEKFASAELREYDPAAAYAFFQTLTSVEHVLGRHRASLQGPVGPVQLWPHGFDLAFEWFGTRVETYEEGGVMTEHPAQLNLGFYPASRPYLYSNPWPFDGDRLLAVPLPADAEWHTGDWEGSILYYDLVAGTPDGEEEILAYAKAVFDAAAPTLMA